MTRTPLIVPWSSSNCFSPHNPPQTRAPLHSKSAHGSPLHSEIRIVQSPCCSLSPTGKPRLARVRWKYRQERCLRMCFCVPVTQPKHSPNIGVLSQAIRTVSTRCWVHAMPRSDWAEYNWPQSTTARYSCSAHILTMPERTGFVAHRKCST